VRRQRHADGAELPRHLHRGPARHQGHADIALIGMPLGSLYGVVVGYLVSRTRFFGRQAMEIVSMVNYAMPGTIVGIAYLIAFNDKPLALTGGVVIIIACYIFRYSPAGIRTTIALLQQIDRSIEEASFSLGAGS